MLRRIRREITKIDKIRSRRRWKRGSQRLSRHHCVEHHWRSACRGVVATACNVYRVGVGERKEAREPRPPPPLALFGNVLSVRGKKKKTTCELRSRCAACSHVRFISRGILVPKHSSYLSALFSPLSLHITVSLSLSLFIIHCASRALSKPCPWRRSHVSASW